MMNASIEPVWAKAAELWLRGPGAAVASGTLQAGFRMHGWRRSHVRRRYVDERLRAEHPQLYDVGFRFYEGRTEGLIGITNEEAVTCARAAFHARAAFPSTALRFLAVTRYRAVVITHAEGFMAARPLLDEVPPCEAPAADEATP